MKNKIIIGLISLTLLITVIGVVAYIYYDKHTNTMNEEEVVFEIESGDSVKKVGQKLFKEGVIKSELLFDIYYKMNLDGSTFVAGTYLIKINMSFEDLMKEFVVGNSIPMDTNRVTLPEGLTTEQTLETLSSSLDLNLDKLNSLIVNGDWGYWFLEGIQKDEHRLDGFLFPDTYEFTEGMSEEDVLSTLLNRTSKVMEPLRGEITSSEFTVREIMTLASLIEKEARHDEDRPKIAGVIYNRLDIDMLLQIDATVLAVIGHKQTVTYDDLKVDSPYNTYKYKGLPPSPIAMPGLSSIQAALRPEDDDYLFYVANRETGYHHFAKTYEEHEENIGCYGE